MTYRAELDDNGLQEKLQRVARELGAAKKRGLKKAAAAVDRAQVDNLSGAGGGCNKRGDGAPTGGYPVPVRCGHLRQGHIWDVVNSNLAIVGNTAAYARVIHDGTGSSAAHGPRPFLEDAARDVDVADIMADEVSLAIKIL